MTARIITTTTTAARQPNPLLIEPPFRFRYYPRRALGAGEPIERQVEDGYSSQSW